MFCKNIDRLISAPGHSHLPKEWKIFIDRSELSIKTVFLLFPNVSVAYGVHLKETFDILKLILDQIYRKQMANKCRFKVSTFNFIVANWSLKTGSVLGQKSVRNELLVPPAKII